MFDECALIFSIYFRRDKSLGVFTVDIGEQRISIVRLCQPGPDPVGIGLLVLGAV